MSWREDDVTEKQAKYIETLKAKLVKLGAPNEEVAPDNKGEAFDLIARMKDAVAGARPEPTKTVKSKDPEVEAYCVRLRAIYPKAKPHERNKIEGIARNIAIRKRKNDKGGNCPSIISGNELAFLEGIEKKQAAPDPEEAIAQAELANEPPPAVATE